LNAGMLTRVLLAPTNARYDLSTAVVICCEASEIFAYMAS